ncbi:MAG: hypothetical protein WC979_01145 [Candidatus Pacearchaeota archaeon]|jgi:hypothetical protein|nr:hypothetical protein [Clostridia bacterium]
MKINLSFEIASEDFLKMEKKNLDIEMTDITEDIQSISYTTKIPKHLYSYIVDTTPWFMKEGHKGYNDRGCYPPYKQKIVSTDIRELRKIISEASTYAIERKRIELANETKVICIKFSTGTLKCRTDYNHADAGLKTNISFQYFVSYVKETNRYLFNDEDAPKIKTYYSRKRNSPTSATTAHTDTGGCETTSEFLHHSHNNAGIFEREYTIIAWTKEREEFFEKVQQNFIKLSNELSNFLLNLDNDKVDALMSNSNLILLQNNQ